MNAQFTLGYVKFMHLYCVTICHLYCLLKVSSCLKVEKTGVLDENQCLPQVTEIALSHYSRIEYSSSQWRMDTDQWRVDGHRFSTVENGHWPMPCWWAQISYVNVNHPIIYDRCSNNLKGHYKKWVSIIKDCARSTKDQSD